MNSESKKSIQKTFNPREKNGDRKIFIKIAAFLILAIITLGNLPGLKVGAAGTITGTVFQDFNGNGNFDTSGGTAAAPTAVDSGVGGVTITAYDSTGTAQGTTTASATDGTYTLNATGTGPYRLEFTTLPAGFVPSARNTDSVNGGSATNSGSTVQFVANGNTTNVNLAINRPEEFCQNNPDLVTCRYNLGAQNGTFANSPVLQSFPYNAGTIYTDTVVANYDAPTVHTLSVPSSSIGSVFGLAYSRATRRIYASAFYKRNSGFGPGANGTFDAAPSTTSDEPGAIYLINPATNAKVGTFTVPGATNNNHSNAAADDTTDASFDAIGKTGLGGMALADDESRLFVMNLQNNTLYALNPTTGANLGSQVVPTPANCPAADVRPFAVKFYRGNVYVGTVCSAQSTAAAANLRAYVYQVNPTTLAFGATPYTFSLNYNRGFANDGAANTAEWRPWFATVPTANFAYPQPMLTDIEFDNGNMVLGIRDRYGDQGLENIVRPGGETLRACGTFTAANFPGTLTLEANGRCGGIGTAPQNTGQGPGAAPGTDAGSGEYYFQDDFSNPANGANFHDEVSLGGLTHIPGYGQTISTIFDPIARPISDQVHDGGFRWFNNATGATTKAYRIYDGDGNPANTPDFGKANGLGDLIPLCNSAPIEIGNRVWNDANGNGVQDPGEAPIAGVTVELYSGTTPVTYTRYRDEFTNIAYNGTNGSVDWSGTPFTEVSDDASATAGDVQVIASGSALGNLVRIGDTGNGVNRVINLAGSSSATLSFDYFRAGQGLIVQYSTDGTNYINLQTIAAATDAVLQTATVALPVNATNIRFVSNTAGATNYVYLDNVQITTNVVTTTDANGEYYFSSAPGTTTGANAVFDANIQPNTAYQIRFSGTPIANLIATQATVTAQNGNDTANDSNVVNATGGLRVINYTTGATAGSNDHTLDAGFTTPVSIGSTIFNDPNNNGIFDTGETGIGGVTVQLLYDANGDGVINGTELTTPFAATTTSTVAGAVGNYFFGGLTPGVYQILIPTPPATATLSSTVTVAIDNQVDNDDNGTQAAGAGGATLSPLITLLPGTEPLNAVETGQGGTQDDATGDANGDMTVDFGFLAPASIGNFVFSDLNRNGIQDNNEPGINGVTVTLYDSGNNVIGTTTTATVGGVAGQYTFAGLAPGTYSVGFTLPPGFGYAFSPVDQGANDALDSDANPATGRTGTYTLTAGQNNTTVDAGLVQTLSLGNQVFNDANNSGVREATEVGIAGVTVNLYLDANNDGIPDGAAIATTTTDANGLYLFTGLAPNNYIVGVVTPANYISSSVNGGDPDNNIDNDDNGVLTVGNETRSNPITLALATEPTGETPTNDPNTPDNNSNLTLDFGFTPSYSLGNRVWFDTNNDGMINNVTGNVEVGAANVSVSLFASGNLTTALQTITTDANGYYRFDNLIPGTYVVRINSSNFVNGAVLAGYQNTAGSTAADLDSTSVTGQNGEDGINPTGAANTIQTLGILSNVITLGGLAEPTGELDVLGGTIAGQGTLDNQANMTIDFGFYQMSLSGTVWNDTGAGIPANSNNGILNAGETGIRNVRVRIYNSANVEILVGPDGILGTADDAAGGMLTNAAGNYNFQGLPPGIYRVVIAPNGGTSSGPTVIDPNANVDNDDNGFPDNTGSFPGQIISGLITLTPGGEVSFTNASGSTFNPTVDFGFIVAPTLVKLDNFDVYTDGSSVELKWSTGDEVNNLGFNVYREVGGKRQLLNSAPIAGSALQSSAQLRASGQDYTWTDKQLVPNAVYYLEDLDMDGSASIHGAVAPQSRAALGNQPNALMFSDLARSDNATGVKEFVGDQTISETSIKDMSAAAARQRKIAALGGAKIIINHDGWYRVSADQLRTAGFDTNSNPQGWQLYADGAEVPFKLNADSIEFFGRGLDTPLTDKQVYYLINGQKTGLRINSVEGGAASDNADAHDFNVTVERKDRAVYLPRLLNGDADNWFGAFISRSTQTVQNLNVVNVNENGKSRLSVKIQGVNDIDHSVSVRFNDFDLGTVELSGTENKQFDFDLPAAAVREGVNSVFLKANNGGSDVNLVDAIRLSYQRGYTASDNRLRFTVPAFQSVRVNGFTDAKISVYEIAKGAARQQVVGAVEDVEGNYGFSLSAANAEREMIAVVNSTVENAAVERNALSTWNRAENQADFVIITASNLRESADNLAAMREAQGLKTNVVLVDDLFDEFTFGRRDPQAVQQFLKTATTVWKTKPNYALLFGDSSYDTRNNLGLTTTRDIVPTKLVDAGYLQTSSDAWLADFNNDGAEDIALGRLPVGDAAEAAAAVEKLARFDRQAARQTKSDVLVADNGFADYSATLQTLLPGDAASFRIDRGTATDAETHQRIVEQLSGNPFLVTYTGHGAQTIWANSGIFNDGDAAGLNNTELSFYLLMNCLNGYTFDPTGTSISESLIKAPNGAIAVWASSGITEAESQSAISEAFTRLAFGEKASSMRVGDVVKAAKTATDNSDVRRTWQLIGDPTTMVK